MPRSLTRNARRRSWNERPVRIWMILTLVVLVATIYVAIRDVGDALLDRRLIRDGHVLPATIDSIDTYSRPDRSFARDIGRNLKVEYSLEPSNPPLTAELVAPPTSADERLTVGQTIDLRIDPTDPKTMTLRTSPRTWTESLSVLFLFCGALVLVAAITLWQRMRVLRIWRTGQPAVAVAVDFHHTGIAPRSRLLRFTLQGSADEDRLYSTLWPGSAGDLEAGDTVDVLIPPGGDADRAIVTRFYE